MKKVGIATVCTGYNFGSALQAYATKLILNDLGFDGVLLGLKGSLIKGRDIRLKKMLVMSKRVLFHYNKFKKHIKTYKSSLSAKITEDEKMMFEKFSETYLKPYYTTWRELKKDAKSGNYYAFFAGSDQIWNSEALYVDPFYYLRFAPKQKRIAFVPSFGRSYIADYNKKVIGKYIKDFNRISVREQSAVGIVKELTGKQAECLLDPTLIVPKEKWKVELKISEINEKYILAYFLNEPSDYAKKYMQKLAEEKNMKILSIGCGGEDSTWLDVKINAGPKEFVEYLSNADYVCTDSFHGTAFSVNFGIPFFTFQRQYGNAGEQSERIKSLLSLTKMESKYEPEMKIMYEATDKEACEEILKAEREKAGKYLSEVLGLR